MSRVENVFGSRESWSNGDERVRVEAGKRRAAAAGKRVTERPGNGRQGKDREKARRDCPSAPLARANSPEKGNVPAKELKKAGFAAGGNPGINGFLSIACGECGRVTNTCLREKRTIFNCKTCGHPTQLDGLVNIHFKCHRCGFVGCYRSNRRDKEIQMDCLNCGQPVGLRRIRRGNYVPACEIE